MSVTANFALVCTVEEVVDLGMDIPADPTITHAISGTSGVLDASSAVPATKAWTDERTLAAGADTIDLTALEGGDLPDISFSGLKVQLVKIKADATNTAAVSFATGASNGYAIFGTSGVVALSAGACCLFYMADKLGDVGSGAKTVDVTSADADAKYQIELVAG